MAIAEKNATEVRSARTPSPVGSGLIGAVYLLTGVVLILGGIPLVWASFVEGPLVQQLNSFMTGAIRLSLQLAAIIVWLSGLSFVVGAKPPVGTRGGIFLSISMLISVLFTARAIGLWMETWSMFSADPSTGLIAFAIVVAVLLGIGLWMLTRKTARNVMVALEEQGWFHVHAYKGNQGHMVRRLTILGISVMLLSGVYTLTSAGSLNQWTNRGVDQGQAGWNDWLIKVPFSEAATSDAAPRFITLLPDIQFMIPLLLVAASIWFAVRVVNFPMFADFLIATEAEMNKVSWVSRKRLIQDTIVVLITVFLLTTFLLIVDFVWGKSLTWMRVLPSASSISAPKTPGSMQP